MFACLLKAASLSSSLFSYCLSLRVANMRFKQEREEKRKKSLFSKHLEKEITKFLNICLNSAVSTIRLCQVSSSANPDGQNSSKRFFESLSILEKLFCSLLDGTVSPC